MSGFKSPMDNRKLSGQMNVMVKIIIGILLAWSTKEKVERASGEKKARWVLKYKTHPLILLVGEPLESYKRVKRAYFFEGKVRNKVEVLPILWKRPRFRIKTACTTNFDKGWSGLHLLGCCFEARVSFPAALLVFFSSLYLYAYLPSHLPFPSLTLQLMKPRDFLVLLTPSWTYLFSQKLNIIYISLVLCKCLFVYLIRRLHHEGRVRIFCSNFWAWEKVSHEFMRTWRITNHWLVRPKNSVVSARTLLRGSWWIFWISMSTTKWGIASTHKFSKWGVSNLATSIEIDVPSIGQGRHPKEIPLAPGEGSR